MIEKAIDVKAKTSLQPASETRKIDFKYLKNYRLLAKKDKIKANQEHRDRNKDMAKFYNLSLVNTN